MFSRGHLLNIRLTYIAKGTKMNKYGIEVGIATVSKIFGRFLFEGNQDHPMG